MKKVILITGGSDGLGKALAEKLSTEHSVIILGKDKEKTARVAQEIVCDFVVADVSDLLQVEEVVQIIQKKYTRIDALVNNAGVWIEGSLENNSYQDIAHAFEVNTLGSIFMSKAVLPLMKQEKSGKIINVVSQAGWYAKAERSIYTATKWAMTGFTYSLSQELASFGISVSGFYPGAMKTDFFSKVGIQKDQSKYMEVSEAVRALIFMLETPDHTTIPELGLKNILN